MINDDLTLLKEDIELGKLDFALADIMASCQARLDKICASKTTADFGIGDRIRINERCGARALVGCEGAVIGKKRLKVVVKLDKPAGKYFVTRSDGTKESSDITVPLSILDKI